MRHRVAGRKFSLPSDQRRALLKGLVRALIEHDKIVTTEARAKEVRPIAEKLITLAKQDDIRARRLVRRYLDSNVAQFGVNTETGKLARNPHYMVPRLFEVVAPRYRNRPGGYCRITKLGARRGDGAPLVVLELVDSEYITPTAPAVEKQVVTRRRWPFFRRKKATR
jgi:large subunit ribosomal protein L17